MSVIRDAVLPRDERGNDPNDWRNDDSYTDKIRPAPTGLSWVEGFKVSKQEAEAYEKPEWLYENLIIGGHVIAIPAPPNGGKTTIFMHIAGELSREGMGVYYVNADVGQSDAKAMVDQAERDGFNLLLPDMKPGLSMADVVANLEAMNEAGGNFSEMVFIFDTLKKMTDVINKTRAKDLYKSLRSLSAKGMTIVLLAHTNKYMGEDGKPIYEGTGDLRSDVDELIYLIPQKNSDGSMTVSAEPDKVRGKFEPITFDILPDRTVIRRNEYVDVITLERDREQREADEPVIELITQSIRTGDYTEAKILAYVRAAGAGLGRRTVTKVLHRYTGKLWRMERTFKDNAKQYALLSAPPASRTNG